MSTFTIYPTIAAAMIANIQAAEAAGCDMVVVTELHTRINHPTDGRSALRDGVGTVTRDDLEADGWFPAPSMVAQSE